MFLKLEIILHVYRDFLPDGYFFQRGGNRNAADTVGEICHFIFKKAMQSCPPL